MQLKKYLFIFLVSLLAACSKHDNSQTFQGYMEGEYLYIATSVSGHLEKLLVHRGELVAPQQSLFLLEQTDELAQLHATKAQLNNAKATLRDILTGKRPSEIDAIMAQIRQAQSAQKLAAINFTRDKKQYAIGAITQVQLDTSRSNYETSTQQVKELQDELITAKLPNRKQQIFAQEALVRYAEANVHDAEWKLSQTRAKAMKPSLVYDTLYNPSEWVASGNPIVILLPEHNLKIRFFVPETFVGKLQMGQPVTITCDGCKKNIQARISYISDQAEYTSPLIFSNDTRDKLTFRVEAKPVHPNLLTMHPGQPVEVSINERV